MRSNFHIRGIFLGVVFYVSEESLFKILRLLDNAETYWDFFINYFVLFGMFGLSIVMIMYYASRVTENVAGIRSVFIYIIFMLIIPTYLFVRMLNIAFDIECIIEVASLLYSGMVLLFVFLKDDIFAS